MSFARGTGGQLRYGHQVAAEIGDWSLDLRPTGRGADCWTLRADLASTDDFWIAQGPPFEVRLHLGRTLWLWKAQAVAVQGRRFTLEGQGRPHDERTL